MSNLRDRIFAHDDIGKSLVEVPEWDVTVELRTMTAGERSKMMKAALDDEGKVDMSALFPMLLIAATFDPETDEQVFSEGDIAALQQKSAAVVERLGQQAMKLSGMGEDAVDEEGKDS